ncbi:TIGR03364 family FAD-dependent oxidoreductase [soil metagenome]
MTPSYDVGVVGAGIVGLAHAYHLARRGQRVVVFERNAQARGASVRNFGMIWPIGQPAGDRYDLALRSREHWRAVLSASGLWHDFAGSLHLAYHEDEAQVLREFTDSVAGEGRQYELLNANEIHQRVPHVRTDGLQAGLFSREEMTVDPRQVIAELPAWLSATYGVQFQFETTVRGYDDRTIETTRGSWHVPRLVVCTGIDFREIAPEAFASSGLVPCKLQMMRTQPYGDEFRIGPMLAAGLTLRHYQSFSRCPSLPALIDRLDTEMPEYHHFGIHVMTSQNGRGEVIIGDSHEYGGRIEPFDKTRIDDLVLSYLASFLEIPSPTITGRWHGYYIKHPTEAFLIANPRPNLKCVNGVGGAGMTLSFGVAELAIADW